MSTYIELREQAAEEIRAQIGSTSADSSHHFVVDHSNYLVEHGAVLLAALRLWAEPRHMTDRDLRALLDMASAATLENIADQLARSHRPDDLLASVQLEGIAFGPPRRLHETLEVARKGLQPSEAEVIPLTLANVGRCQQTSAPIDLYGPLRDDVMGLP